MDIEYKLKLTLEELYRGAEKTIEYEVNRLCSLCNYELFDECQVCLGEGILINYQKHDILCDKCFGSGKDLYIDPGTTLTPTDNSSKKFKCEHCLSKGYLTVKKLEKISILPGTLPNEKIVLHGGGHIQPFYKQTGNLIIEIDIWYHEYFEFNAGSCDLSINYYHIHSQINDQNVPIQISVKTIDEQIITIRMKVNSMKNMNNNNINSNSNSLSMSKKEKKIEIGNYGLFHKDKIHRGKLYLNFIP